MTRLSHMHRAVDRNEDMREALLDLLDGVVGGRRYASARSKTVTVLCRVWGGVAPGTEGATSSSAGNCFLRSTLAERIVLSLGDVPCGLPCSSSTSLQSLVVCSICKVRRRWRSLRGEQWRWGDREKVRGGAQKRSSDRWPIGAVFERRGQGRLSAASSSDRAFRPRFPSRRGIDLRRRAIGTAAAATPAPSVMFSIFQLELSAHDLRKSLRFEVDRQGLDVDVVSLSARAPA